MLFSYKITYKVATRYTPYQLVYGLHPLMPTKYIMLVASGNKRDNTSVKVLTNRITTTTTGGYFAIQISSQITKNEVSESLLLRTIIPRKFISLCDTITFAPIQLQVLRNSRT
jgi:hypothetical protein